MASSAPCSGVSSSEGTITACSNTYDSYAEQGGEQHVGQVPDSEHILLAWLLLLPILHEAVSSLLLGMIAACASSKTSAAPNASPSHVSRFYT